ncbi:substrate-binding domain-containing protein [Caballeronia novacaledonica]|uniref:Substrate-binding domain-containing protein n=1 Tax=Caballeronia novacaledonica TaxID=1544861 RepID=A0ACB5QRC2_9BURK|nr:substrate-binding domain-containing protein [Caballeronia novacaledonica]
MKARPTLKELMEATQLSRATIDRALNDRPGVHPRTKHAVAIALEQLSGRVPVSSPSKHIGRGTLNFSLILQAGDAFTDEFTRCAAAVVRAGVRLKVVRCVGMSDADVATIIREEAERAHGIGITCMNTDVTVSALRECMAAGNAVVTMITDVDAQARHIYVGVNNRAAGQSAAFLIGRNLQGRESPAVAVVVATFSYSCHEDREIGFRSLLRHRFPNVNLVEVIKGADSGAATFDATRRCLDAHGELAGIYNVAGGNEGLAAALREYELVGRTLFVTHEVNRVTEPLLRSEVIDYLLTQDLARLVGTTVEHLCAICETRRAQAQAILPIETYSKYSL